MFNKPFLINSFLYFKGLKNNFLFAFKKKMWIIFGYCYLVYCLVVLSYISFDKTKIYCHEISKTVK